jgi:hypothetical protein
MTRTVVKANYVRAGGGANATANATMRASAQYYGHRPDADGARQYRPGFDAERDEIGKEEAYRHAEQGQGEYAYRIVASPGREMDAEELRGWTRDVMQGVEEAGGTWMGFVHDDHTEHPHVHVIAFTEEKLNVEDFGQMREEGDLSAEQALEYRHESERDPMENELSANAAREQEESAAGSEKEKPTPKLPGRKHNEMDASQGH